MYFPFQKQAEKEELLHVKMATPLLFGVARDNSLQTSLPLRTASWTTELSCSQVGPATTSARPSRVRRKNATVLIREMGTASLHSLSLTFRLSPWDKPPREVTPAEALHGAEPGRQREGTMKPADPCRARCPLPPQVREAVAHHREPDRGLRPGSCGGIGALPAIDCCGCQGEAAAIGAGPRAGPRGDPAAPPPAPPLRRGTRAPWRQRLGMAARTW